MMKKTDALVITFITARNRRWSDKTASGSLIIITPGYLCSYFNLLNRFAYKEQRLAIA